MAKREIPEINAGSMADIAFLLLIFFLVTTTMDKDQAYIRNIPKKVVVETPPIDVEQRNVLAIKANNQNQLMVRGEIIGDPDKISDKIIEFYNINRISNDLTNDFPTYTHPTKNEININLRNSELELESYELRDAGEALIDYANSKIDEWDKMNRSLKLYGGNDFPLINSQANIRIEVQTRTQYSLFAKIQSEIEQAIFELRDVEAKRIFGESYGVIKSRYITDEEPDDKGKIELLDILYPARIIEVTPKN
jgi:biopolymer transport protein ExbD